MRGRERAGEFVTEVCELAKDTLVILALRADFYTHALRYPGLAAALQSRHIVLGPMTAEQVRRAITEPARLARVDVEEGLVGLLLRDVTPPERGGRASRLRTWRAAAAVLCPARDLGARPR